MAEERLARARTEREEARAAEERRVEAARRAAAAAARIQGVVMEEPLAGEENVRRPWDTGPIFIAARNAAVRTLRTVRGRTAERESLSA